jgi:eukaryotic-like serine/threonine-protein kinase
MAKDTIGKYKVLEMIGEGGMGKVYKAFHPDLKRNIVIKQVSARTGKIGTQRFQREARIMLDFRCDNIVPVYDYFREGRSYYIAMEFIEGLALDEVIKQKGTVDPLAAVILFREICKGMLYAHEMGIVHRDLKPANIMVSKNGQVKILDFGIARMKHGAEDDAITSTGMSMGTPAYMSPEQIDDAKRVDHRSDIYSLGVVLYEILTGKKPFPGNFSAEAIHQITKGKYTKPQKHNPKLPVVLKRIIRKAMHRNPRKRYKSLSELIKVFDKIAAGYNIKRKPFKEIAGYAFGGKGQKSRLAKNFRSKLKPAFFVPLTIFLILGLGFGSFYAYREGLFYELLRPKEYGSLQIQVEFPENYYKELDAVYAQAVIKNLNSDEPEEPEKVYRLRTPDLYDRIFSKINQREGTAEPETAAAEPEPTILSTNRLYLPSGYYSVELNVENRKYYASFYLKPRVIQREQLKTNDRRLVEYSYQPVEGKPMDFDIHVYGQNEGEDLYAKAAIVFTVDGSEWFDWKALMRQGSGNNAQWLRSGRLYTFKISAPAYYEKTFDLFVEPALDSGNVEVYLIKKSQKLVVESNTDNLKILIDNQEENFIGGETKEFVEYGSTEIGEKEFLLTPGNYVLTFMRSKNNFENLQIDITDEQPVQLKVTYDETDNSIEITRIE